MIAAWFIAHPLLAKSMYINIVSANDAVSMPRVDPMRTLHFLELYSSIFLRQYSAQVWARSTSGISPRSTNSIAPARAKY